MHPYLLQVWSNKGEMLFEKPLMKPVVNWNISKDRLMFIEEIDSTTFYLVKLFPDEQPIIYRFWLPSSIHNARAVKKEDPNKNQTNPLAEALMKLKQKLEPIETSPQDLLAPDQNATPRLRRLKTDLSLMKSLGEVNKN